MDADQTPDDDDLDDLRDPLTPVDLLLPGAWRSPRPDLRAARRPGDGAPLAAPAPVVRNPSSRNPSTLPLPLGDLDGAVVAAATPRPPLPPDHAPLPPLPEWSAAPPPRAAGSRAVLAVAAGLVVVGGVSLWLGLLPTGGDGSPASSGATVPGAAVVPASEPSTADPPAAATTTKPTPKATRTAPTTKTAPRTSTSRTATRTRATRPSTVLVRASAYVGRPAKEVQQALRRLGLRVDVQLVTTTGPRRPGGTVVSVRPTGRVPAGSTVVVVVAV